MTTQQPVAGSAVWLTLYYEAQPGTRDLFNVLRLAFASATAASLLLAATAIRRRDLAAPGASMTRAHAIGLAAGTQAFTEGIAGAIVATGQLRMDPAKGAVGYQPGSRRVGHTAAHPPAPRPHLGGTTATRGAPAGAPT